MNPLERLKLFFRRRKTRELDLRLRDQWGRTELPENVQDMNYRASWDKQFNEAVIHQLKEVPTEYKRHWKEEQERSTEERRRFWKKKEEKSERTSRT